MGVYLRLTQTLERVAQKVNPDGVFFEGRIADTYNNAGEKGMAIHLYPFKPTRKERVFDCDVSLGFWQPDSLDNSIEDRRQIIDRMNELCDSFLMELENENVEIGEDTGEPQYQTLSNNYSGYFINLKIQVPRKC